MKAAVAIGGAAALSACLSRSPEVDSTTTTDTQRTANPVETQRFAQGTDSLDDLPERQHEWGKYVQVDSYGNPDFPHHQAFLLLNYVGEDTPTEAERTRVEDAFQTLERAFKRGVGTDRRAVMNDGLLFTVGYAPSYFDRFEEPLPDSVDIMPPAALLERLGEDPANATTCDAAIHLASDLAPVVLAAEEALFGRLEHVNGVEVQGSLDGVFETVERRTGFVGSGFPKERLRDDIPARAPVSMGFKSNYRDTFPSEDKITITEGPFAGGSVQQLSKLRNHLDEWYDQDHEQRVEKMFSPDHSSDTVGDVGENLASKSEITREIADRTLEDAQTKGRVGHGQKLARVRDDDDEPLIMRRGDFNAAAESGAILHFGSLQRGIDEFVKTRDAMNEVDLDGTGDGPELPDSENGILDFIEVLSRSTFLVPPRQYRSLPTPRPS
ncbi:Dyp-type peroxidase [Haloarchaeobius sp. HME9146]|uniref:Dyp-type peroxidase n=1 Tax=Haloarchaeobius sp. HME9146 TaxID=2978732 RepID=UPI0021BF1707|nr:Dyp-type peroxidase [Haloarchaeobius sp. HME9146]MCT9098018.1 Dyp-type peroxidase [Haloarchaeobius sp. HME9146]